jgi:hypothetical protein
VSRAVVLLAAAAAVLAFGAAGSRGAPAVTEIDLLSLTVAASSHATPSVPGLPAAQAPVREVTESDRLYNGVRQFGRRRLALVGTDRTILLHYRSGRVWVSVTAQLPGGQIYVRGDLRRSRGVAVADVVGGSGRYAHVRGTLTIRNLSQPATAANVYRLTATH